MQKIFYAVAHLEFRKQNILSDSQHQNKKYLVVYLMLPASWEQTSSAITHTHTHKAATQQREVIDGWRRKLNIFSKQNWSAYAEFPSWWVSSMWTTDCSLKLPDVLTAQTLTTSDFFPGGMMNSYWTIKQYLTLKMSAWFFLLSELYMAP